MLPVAWRLDLMCFFPPSSLFFYLSFIVSFILRQNWRSYTLSDAIVDDCSTGIRGSRVNGSKSLQGGYEARPSLQYTPYFRRVDTDYNREYVVLTLVYTQYTKHYAVIMVMATVYTKEYAVFSGGQY